MIDYAQIEDILLNWDAKAEQRKADFLDELYNIYKPESCTYTGLWLTFKEDLACFYRDHVSLAPVDPNLSDR